MLCCAGATMTLFVADMFDDVRAYETARTEPAGRSVVGERNVEIERDFTFRHSLQRAGWRFAWIRCM